MFTWKVENLEFMNNGFVGDKEFGLNNAFFVASDYEFKCEKQVSTEDKIAFIDSMQDNKMSYFIELNEKYEKDKLKLDKDWKGNVSSMAKEAWLKENDTRSLVNGHTDFSSNFRITIDLLGRNKGQWTRTVNKCFHEQVKECFFKEIKYCLEQDEGYQIVKSFCESLKSYGYASNYIFNVSNGLQIVTNYDWRIGYWSIKLYDKEHSEIEFSIEDVKLLIESFAPVEEKHQNLLKAQAEMNQALKDAGAEFVRKFGF